MDYDEDELLAGAKAAGITFEQLPGGRWQWAEHPPGMTPVYPDRDGALRGLANRLYYSGMVGSPSSPPVFATPDAYCEGMSDRPESIELSRQEGLDILIALEDAALLYGRRNLLSALAECEEAIATLTSRLWPNQGRL